MPVTVKWGKDNFLFELPPPETKLAAIRDGIAHYTQMPYDAFAIVHDGAVMVDDNAPISSYHLRPNSTISVVSDVSLEQAHNLNSNKNTEQSVIADIQAELASVNSVLLPSHSAFLSQLQVLPANPAMRSSLTKERARLSESLLQALMRLDAIIPERDWSSARSHRKAAVLHLQSLLDQLDSAWSNS